MFRALIFLREKFRALITIHNINFRVYILKIIKYLVWSFIDIINVPRIYIPKRPISYLCGTIQKYNTLFPIHHDFVFCVRPYASELVEEPFPLFAWILFPGINATSIYRCLPGRARVHHHHVISISLSLPRGMSILHTMSLLGPNQHCGICVLVSIIVYLIL